MSARIILSCLAFLLVLSIGSARPEDSDGDGDTKGDGPNIPEALELNNAAVKLLDAKHYDEAIRKLVTARNLDPEWKTCRRNLAWAYAHRARHEEDTGDYIRAIESARSARRTLPEVPDFAFLEAAYRYRAGELGMAETLVRKALKLKPEVELKKRATRLLGNILYMQDDLSGALDVFRTLNGDESTVELTARIEREIRILGEYQVDRTSAFRLYYDPSGADLRDGGSLQHLLEKARSQVCNDLNYYPRNRVTVIVYPEKDFRAVTDTEGWVGGLYDRKIRIPLKDIRNNPDVVASVVRHEYTHVILHEIAPTCPLWINEGLACYQQYGPAKGMMRLETFMKRGRSPVPFDELPDVFIDIKEESRVRLYYAQSHAMVEYLVDQFGLPRLHLFLKGLSRDGDWKAVFREAYRRDFDQVERDFLDSLG